MNNKTIITEQKARQRKSATYNNEGKRYVGILCLGIIIVVSIWICYLFAWQVLSLSCIRPYLPGIMLDAEGQLDLSAFGEYFGALNALFAGLAFAGLVVTIRQQSADLRATKREMQAQTTQFRKQDIYHRIEFLQQLERRITCFGYKNLQKQGVTLSIYDDGANIEQQKILLFTEASCRLLEMFRLTNPTPADDEHLNEVAKVLRMNAHYTWSWIKCIYNLLEDIDKNFTTEEEKEQLSRVALNSIQSNSLLLLMLCRDKHMNIPQSVIKRISKIFDSENFINCEENGRFVTVQDIRNNNHGEYQEIVYALHDPRVRGLFLSIILDGVDLEIAEKRWQDSLAERGQKAYLI